jgi:hypothetical protein
MKSLRIFSLTATLLVLAPLASAADFGVRAGRYNDSDEEFVGLDLAFDLGAVTVNPNLEYSLADDVTAGSGNIDLTWDVVRIGRATPYIGAGLGLWYADNDLAPTRTDIVGNLIGGFSLEMGSLKPYAQVKYFRLLDDQEDGDTDDDIALTLGLRF